MKTDRWELFHGDCIPHMAEAMEPKSVDFAVFSPPFPAIFAYSSHPADIGNTSTMDTEANIHLRFFYKALARVLKPGRIAMVHVKQIPRMKRNGEDGLHDFRGTNIRIGERCGLVYDYDWMVRVNPQAQAIQTRSRELQFSGLEADRSKSRGTLNEYLIKFRAPGENASAIDDPNQVSRNQWIDWAEGQWADIRMTDTLNLSGTKGPNETRHICCLPLPISERLIRIYSDPGELVFSPFAGIGSEGVSALKLNRRFYGCELKLDYYERACRELESIEVKEVSTKSLFSDEEIEAANVA